MDHKIISSLNRLLNHDSAATGNRNEGIGGESSAYEDALSLSSYASAADDNDDSISFETPSELSLASSLNTTTATGSGLFGIGSVSVSASTASTAEVIITPSQLPTLMEANTVFSNNNNSGTCYSNCNDASTLHRTQTLRQRQLQRVRQEIEGFQHTAEGIKQHVRVPLESALPVQLAPGDDELEEKELMFAVEEAAEAAEALEETAGTRKPPKAAKAATDQVAFQPGQQLRIVDEKHDNYVLMYDMLTGIRTAVSRCQAKPPRSLTDLDYRAYQKLAFDLTGSDSTPKSRYDFKFKDYAPWVFRSIREGCGIDTADYLVRLID